MYEITGVVKLIKDEEVISEKFKKREFVITDESTQYPQHISFQATQDRTSIVDGIKEGETIKVSFYLRGREWTSPSGEVKYFNSLDAWGVDKIDQGGDIPPPLTEEDEISSLTPASEDDVDDLPF